MEMRALDVSLLEMMVCSLALAVAVLVILAWILARAVADFETVVPLELPDRGWYLNLGLAMT